MRGYDRLHLEAADQAGAEATELELRAARRGLIADTAVIAISVGAYGLVFGLSARAVGLTALDALMMSALVFAGAAQFAALGYLGGVGLAGIVVLTAAVNARNLVYAAALMPWLAARPRPTRALMGHFVNDASFALSMAHFRRLGHTDVWGFWWVAIIGTFLPWNLATIVGALAAGAIPDPSRAGLDVVFPAAMAGTAVTLASDRRAVVAMLVAAPTAVATSLLWDPAGGVLSGALASALVAIGIRRGRPELPRPASGADAPGPGGVS
jgi:predicted branched-subunit amino acid permease